MSDRPRLLLAIDFTTANFPSALYALAQWSQAASRLDGFEITIGLTTSLRPERQLTADIEVRQALALVKGYCGGLDVVCWKDDGAGAAVDAGAVFPAFNYGSVVNKALLLAAAAECRYIVRVDPGTRPPEGLSSVLDEHIEYVAGHPGAVVSRGYAGRLALRDAFVKPGYVDAQRALVREHTTIDVFDQVTGGALFTSAVPGVPAVAFEPFGDARALTLVWASDDGVFQRLGASRGSRRLPDHEVARFDQVGKPKTSFEYYRGVAGATYLFARLRGEEPETARTRVEHFVDRLKPMLDSGLCQNNDSAEFNSTYPARAPLDWSAHFRRELVSPDAFLSAIEQGVEKHHRLVPRWAALCEELRTSPILWRP
jgi:hypothetical protein